MKRLKTLKVWALRKLIGLTGDRGLAWEMCELNRLHAEYVKQGKEFDQRLSAIREKYKDRDDEESLANCKLEYGTVNNEYDLFCEEMTRKVNQINALPS